MHRATKAGKRRPVLGLFTDWLKDSYQNSLVTAVEHACKDEDATLLCFAGGHLESDRTDWSHRNILFEFAGPHLVDALIVLGGNVGTRIGPERLSRYLERFEVPNLVSIAYRMEGTPSVLVDNQVGLRREIEHLITVHGCKSIAFLRGPAENQEAEERFAAYREVLEEKGLKFEPNLTFVGDFLRHSGRLGTLQFLSTGIPFDAIVGANDLMALGALEALTSAGIRVPEDVAVVGFDDGDDARMSLPQLTTVRQPLHLLAREAVRIALAMVDGGPVPPIVKIPTQVVIRRSCGCGARAGSEIERLITSIMPCATPLQMKERFIDTLKTLDADGIAVSVEQGGALFEALAEELQSGVTGQYASRFADLIRATPAESYNPWSRVIADLTHLVSAWTATQVEAHERFDVIAGQLRTAYSDVAELRQGMLRLRHQQLTLSLSDIGKALMGALGYDGIRAALSTYLPALGIPACFMSLYVTRSDPFGGARLAWAFDREDPTADTHTGQEFPCREIAPSRLLFQRGRRSFVLEPLYFEEEQLGLLAIEMGPEEGVVYESIRDQVSGAIRAVLLLERVFAEVKQRQLLEKEQAEKEMQIAATIQTMILPANQRVPGFSITAAMAPAANVGGDYYDILPTADGCWLGIGDVVGHGLRSGLIMLMAQSAVSGITRSSTELTPRTVLSAVNGLLFDNIRTRLHQDEHMTLSLLRCFSDGRVLFAGAHEDILVYRESTGRCEQHRTEGLWAGIVQDVEHVTFDRELQLLPGDTVVLYTDGITEARNVHGTMFGLAQLVGTLERVGRKSPEEICGEILDEVRLYMTSQEDDMALVVARYLGP